MKETPVKKLAEIIDAPDIGCEQVITSVSTDSREIKSGGCFFAIKGENFDGHNFLESAFQTGAVCAVVNKSASLKPEVKDYPLLKVDNTVKALGRFAKFYRNEQNFKTVSITGSVGKTTTKSILYQVLSEKFKCHQAPKSFNNYIGLPLTILSAEPDTQILITELGSNHPGEISNLTEIATPDIAIITAIAASHLDGFKNLESIIEEKLSIAEGLKPGGTLIINGDNPRLTADAQRKGLEFTTFGLSDKNDVSAADIRLYPGSNEFKIEDIQVKLPLPGTAAVSNALAAWSVCRILDIKVETFAEGIARLKPVDKRSQIRKFGNLTVIDDCYNANPASMKNALEILRRFGEKENGRTVFICGDMAELGSRAGELHIRLGQQAAEFDVSVMVAIGEQSRLAGRHFTEKRGREINFFPDTDTACNNLEKIIKDTDIILVKGSRTAGLEKIVQKLEQIFKNTQADKRENK